MAHANARLTVHGRRLIIERARAGWKQAHIAAAMAVARTFFCMCVFLFRRLLFKTHFSLSARMPGELSGGARLRHFAKPLKL